MDIHQGMDGAGWDWQLVVGNSRRRRIPSIGLRLSETEKEEPVQHVWIQHTTRIYLALLT